MDKKLAHPLTELESKASTPSSTPFGSMNSLSPLKLTMPADNVENEDAEKPRLTSRLITARENLMDWFENNSILCWRLFLVVLGMGYAAYFSYAMYYSFGDEPSIRLVWVTAMFVVFLTISLIKKRFGETIYVRVVEPAVDRVQQRWFILKWIFYVILLLGFITYIVLEVALTKPYNLVSLVGIAVYIILFYIFSYSPAKVKWQPVIWGLGLQFILALLILRTSWGYAAFEWLGERVGEFLQHTDAGAKFVFGSHYADHFFAFKVLPVVIFFSSTISVLYYLGVMQVVISKIAWVMQNTMGTTAAESLNAAGNIFVGQTEAPLLIRPMIHDMTRSELHAVMTGGFATIAGSIMATYILIGVNAHHLMTASVISAPAALAMSKLIYPETEESITTAENVAQMEASPQRNVIEAASSGASTAIGLVANIAANLIAFIALLEFLNATLAWFGARVGITPPDYPPLTFQYICSYILWPFAFIMGVDSSDCRQVAQLIGVKTFLNEFVAYSELSVLINNTKVFNNYNGTVAYINDDIYLEDINTWLRGGIMNDHSIVICTYALCGFANISSIGIILGALGAMAPERKSEISGIALRAMIAGNVACFITACIAGLLYTGEI